MMINLLLFINSHNYLSFNLILLFLLKITSNSKLLVMILQVNLLFSFLFKNSVSDF